MVFSMVCDAESPVSHVVCGDDRNRAICLQRTEPTPDDIKLTGTSIVG
jgi:hypothetical protein